MNIETLSIALAEGDGRMRQPLAKFAIFAVLFVCCAGMVLFALEPPQVKPLEIAPVQVLRGMSQTPSDAEMKMLRDVIAEQAQQQDNADAKNAFLRWWPVLVVVAGILVTYGMMRQWSGEMDRRTALYARHISDPDAHWTKREREQLTEDIKEIRTTLQRHFDPADYTSQDRN